MKNSSLLHHEWILVTFLSLFIVLIVSISFYHSYQYPKKYLKSSPILITVTGAVKSPGIYQVYPGVTCKEVLKKAGLLDKTDQKQLDLEKQLYFAQEFAVPELEKITVKVRGAVKEKTLLLKPGTRYCSLKKYISFKDGADLSGMNSRKKLVDGQTITIGFIY